MPTDRPGLYLHIPFCAAICPYCDFAVHVAGAARRRRFVKLLTREIELCAEQEGERWAAAGGFDTVYFGGGTPSLLSAEELARLLAALRQWLPVAPEARLFLEANPEHVSPASLRGWRELGVLTLSLGVQSFDDETLAFLGRGHDGESAVRGVELALGAGFETVSIDLIYALPGQSFESWRRTLDTAIGLAPQHLSGYQLEVHPRTTFGKLRQQGRLREMGEVDQGDLLRAAHERLGAAGYEGYEVSNFSRGRAHRSAHNQKYWRHTPYLGLGPSACSYKGGRRWWNERALPAWERRLERGERPIKDEEILTPEQLALEALMLGLRTKDGIDPKRFHARWGVDLPARNPELIARLVEEGILESTPERLRPTVEGLAVADGLAAAFEL